MARLLIILWSLLLGVLFCGSSNVFDQGAVVDEDDCAEYCERFFQAQERCPVPYIEGPVDAEECIQDCLLSELSVGTPQDFILTDTLSCRKNHAIMAIKEGALTNFKHCYHASLEGIDRCVANGVALEMAQNLEQGKYVFYNPTQAMSTAEPDTVIVYFVLTIRFLMFQRGRLYAAYPSPDLGSTNEGALCNSVDTRFRSIDGTCNSLEMPQMGAQGTPFVRTTVPSAPHPEGDLDIAQVAQILKRPKDDYDEDKTAPFNQLVSAWIQFMTHDWFAHDRNEPGPERHNQVTHWWDASQLYGSTPDDEYRVRALDGKLHLDDNDELDYIKDVPITGFSDNFWVGLHVMHTIFAREHNYVVDQLALAYPGMTDDEKYGTARNCIAAILAKIHTLEWTPTLLDNTVSTLGLNINWYGLRNAVYSMFSREEVGQYASVVDQTQLPSIYGDSNFGTDQTLFNTSFFMTEEFVGVYRMHPLLPDVLQVDQRKIKLSEFAFRDARQLIRQDTTQSFLRALANTPARTLSLQNYPRELYNIKIPGRIGVTSLAEIDLLRDRERGLPRYNDARRQLLLEPYVTLDDLTDDATERQLLKSVYTDIEQVDFMVGCLVDKERPEGFAFGVVPYYVFLVMASRRLFSDRFFMEGFNAENYTPWGLNYVAETTFKSVLDRHFPALSHNIPANPFSNNW